jgi:transcriptional regulator with XRE-family HTH domain
MVLSSVYKDIVMSKATDIQNQIKFIDELRNNKIKTPNDFTIQMGKLIKAAREDKGLSQIEFAQKTSRRPATISDIENGKSEIGVLTLALFAMTLDKPISYFFPNSLLKNHVLDVKSPFQYKMLELSQTIDMIGDKTLTLDILTVFKDHFVKDADNVFNDCYEIPDDEDEG